MPFGRIYWAKIFVPVSVWSYCYRRHGTTVSVCVWRYMQHINESYKTNLQKINNLVLVMFENDTMVEPRESEVRHCIERLLYSFQQIYCRLLGN